MTKKPLSLEELESQAVIELPGRELLAILGVTLNNGQLLKFFVPDNLIAQALAFCNQLVDAGAVQSCARLA